VSIAFFNFAGVSVTKELSATTRMVLDSVRTLVIWMFSLAVRWQKFNYLQLIGFTLLIIGMCLYNNVIIVPSLQRWGLVPAPRRVTGNLEYFRYLFLRLNFMLCIFQGTHLMPFSTLLHPLRL
jgi:hypothetical protein